MIIRMYAVEASRLAEACKIYCSPIPARKCGFKNPANLSTVLLWYSSVIFYSQCISINSSKHCDYIWSKSNRCKLRTLVILLLFFDLWSTPCSVKSCFHSSNSHLVQTVLCNKQLHRHFIEQFEHTSVQLIYTA